MSGDDVGHVGNTGTTGSANRPKVTRFVLVRHGEAAANRELRYLGTTDAPLTERGAMQARQLAAAVCAFAPNTLYSSPLARARDTAYAISAVIRQPIQFEGDLREQSFGAWEMLTRSQALERDRELLLAWESGADAAPPEGESLPAVRERALRLAERLVKANPGQTLVLVSHVGPLKALICAALELPPVGTLRMWLDPASLSVVDWWLRADGTLAGTLRIFNSVAHLDPPARWLTQ